MRVAAAAASRVARANAEHNKAPQLQLLTYRPAIICLAFAVNQHLPCVTLEKGSGGFSGMQGQDHLFAKRKTGSDITPAASTYQSHGSSRCHRLTSALWLSLRLWFRLTACLSWSCRRHRHWQSFRSSLYTSDTVGRSGMDQRLNTSRSSGRGNLWPRVPVQVEQ